MTDQTELERLRDAAWEAEDKARKAEAADAAKNEAWSKVEAALAEEASAWEVARAARDAVEVAWEAWRAALAATTAPRGEK